MRNKEVSGRLCLSEKTVSAHKQNLFRKLGVRSVLQISIAPEEENNQPLRLENVASEPAGTPQS
ncbi:helix-turn-helix domain-containing protein [Kerstersia gyiorum]